MTWKPDIRREPKERLSDKQIIANLQRTGYQLQEKNDELRAENERLRQERDEARVALATQRVGVSNAISYFAQIAYLGGNLTDNAVEGATGPNDAAQRGIWYTTARKIARSYLDLWEERTTD